MYREMLVGFMAYKQGAIESLGIDSPRHFTNEEAQAIFDWDEEVAKTIFERIEKAIHEGEYDLTEYVNPFCLYVMDDNDREDCDACEYAQRHGICREDGSDYPRILELMWSTGWESDAVFTNELYREILKKIRGS